MDIRPLVDVELREALAPLNRPTGVGQAGQLGRVVRTPAQLRERAAAQVLDLKLSRACYIGDGLVGAVLVDRVGESAHLEALGVEPLAQQRGAGRALLESLLGAAKAAGVKQLSFFVSDFDSALQPILTTLGFARGRDVARYSLQGPPAALPLPRELGPEAAPEGEGPFVRPLPTALTVAVLTESIKPEHLLFTQQPEVLTRLSKDEKLVAYVSALPGLSQPNAAALFDRDRKVLLALAGEAAHLGPLLCLLATRRGVNALDALAEGHPAEAGLQAAGYTRAALRAEWVKDLG